ncbi:MAG: hypothetical protein AAF742_05785 [Pseudomonadota bacterium]
MGLTPTDKKRYERPALARQGSVESLTHGNADGATTDAFFPTNTPFSDITFS